MILLPGSLHIFVSSFFVKTTKIPKIGCEIYISMCPVFSCFALQGAKAEHMEIKVSKPIFGILVALTKNELTKICNDPGIKNHFRL